uniref:Uncharacterized protein n=1 Tax=Nelumbo nucifera TaxID=4432 RepID=A0A822YYP3_NELNU|nr:TPA_asm: hypothetical protein HUJ06_005018 [Nelumbo nucifera]
MNPGGVRGKGPEVLIDWILYVLALMHHLSLSLSCYR